MTKKERIAALEKAVADMAAKLSAQEGILLALASRPAPQTFEAPRFGYDPNTCVSGDPPGTVGYGSTRRLVI